MCCRSAGHRNGFVLKFAYRYQFIGEKDDLKIRYLVAKRLSKTPVLFFWTPCRLVLVKSGLMDLVCTLFEGFFGRLSFIYY